MIYKFIARVLFPPSFARIYRPEQKRAFPRETQLAGHTSRRALRESGDLTPLALGCEFSLSYALALLYIHVYVYIYTRVSLSLSGTATGKRKERRTRFAALLMELRSIRLAYMPVLQVRKRCVARTAWRFLHRAEGREDVNRCESRVYLLRDLRYCSCDRMCNCRGSCVRVVDICMKHFVLQKG